MLNTRVIQEGLGTSEIKRKQCGKKKEEWDEERKMMGRVRTERKRQVRRDGMEREAWEWNKREKGK